MTAEVAILNRGAVAIAADSAVTLGGPGRKIYNTANKLFPLSATEPVAVMVYGSGSFGPIPWETVVKEHRRDLGSRTFASVAEYADEFLEYLSSLVPHVPPEQQQHLVKATASTELEAIREATFNLVLAASQNGGAPTDDEIISVLSELIDHRHRELEGLGFVAGLSERTAGQLIGQVINDWPGFARSSLGRLGVEIGEGIVRRTRALVRASLRTAGATSWYSGVVVAGFGSDQLFPALTHCLVDGVVGGVVRTGGRDDTVIGVDQSAMIRPFAQEDMVATFMNGMHPGYRTAIDGFVDQTIGQFIDHFCDEVRDSLDDAANQAVRSKMDAARDMIVGQFQSRLNSYLEASTSGPIMSIVELLPKEELAEMAEALVNLTSFKRRVTPDAETVGGPIDVDGAPRGGGNRGRGPRCVQPSMAG